MLMVEQHEHMIMAFSFYGQHTHARCHALHAECGAGRGAHQAPALPPPKASRYNSYIRDREAAEFVKVADMAEALKARKLGEAAPATSKALAPLSSLQLKILAWGCQLDDTDVEAISVSRDPESTTVT